MAKEFVTQGIADVDIEQVILTHDKQTDKVRVRSNVSVVLANKIDATDTHKINIPVNKTVVELGIPPATILAIRRAVLDYVKAQLNEIA